MTFAGGVLATAVGAVAIFWSFLGGMVFSQVFRSKARFEEKVHALGFGFLVPFFFVGVGAQFDIQKMLAWQPFLQTIGLTLGVGASNLVVLLLVKPLNLWLLDGLGRCQLL